MAKALECTTFQQWELKFRAHEGPQQPETEVSEPIVISHHDSINSLIGPSATVTRLLSSTPTSGQPFFHTGLAYRPAQGEIYTTSAPLQPTNTATLPAVLISRIHITNASGTPPTPENPAIAKAVWSKLRPPPGMAMPAGCAAFHDGILYAEQGTIKCAGAKSSPALASILYMPTGQRPKCMVREYVGRSFNSPGAVAVDGGAVWFTDTVEGARGEFRGFPTLPCAVYRFDVEKMECNIMANGFDRPVGVAVSPDGMTVYVADREDEEKHQLLHQASVGSIYAFDVAERNGAVVLLNRRLFTVTKKGKIGTIACDPQGNLFAACSDGLEIWTPSGTFLGVVALPGGASSFAFGGCHDIIIGGSQNLWRLNLGQVKKEDQ